MEEEWAKYKYWVMARSQEAYNTLRLMFKDNATVDLKEFYKIIESLKDVSNPKAELNAFQHVWGYFKKDCTDFEKKQFLTSLDAFKHDETKRNEVYSELNKLAKKYQKLYLLESYYFDDHIKKTRILKS